MRLKFWVLFFFLGCMVQSCNSLTQVQTNNSGAGCSEVGQTWVSPVDEMSLVCVPAGDFWMGAVENDTQAQADEKPRHKVYLDSFWIDRTEVTNSMFAQCVAAEICHPRSYSPYMWGVASRTRDPYFDDPSYDSFPVIMLDADEAETYCHWAGRRLPSEAEWEKTAHGTGDQTYPWGEGIDCQKSNYAGCIGDTSETTTHSLGASPYGVLDMLGNVWEWTADWYAPDAYTSAPYKNPSGPSTGEYHVMRGGAFGSFVNALRITNRANGKPEHGVDGEVGFRCALSDQK